MIHTLWNNLLTAYKAFIGTGTLHVLFVVSLIVIAVVGIKEDDDGHGTIWPYVLTIWGTIAVVFARFFMSDYGDRQENDVERTKAISLAGKLIVSAILVVILVISGRRILSSEYLERAENTYHISQDLVDSMNYITSDSNGQETKALIMPGYVAYCTAYTSKVASAYEDPIGGDVSSFETGLREAYLELLDKYPDMRKVSDAARTSGCQYILLRNDSYWPKQPLESYDYDLVAVYGEWNIYKSKSEVNVP